MTNSAFAALAVLVSAGAVVVYVVAVRVRLREWVLGRDGRSIAIIVALALAIGVLGLVMPPLSSSALVGLGLVGVGAWLIARTQRRSGLRRAGWLALTAGSVVLLGVVVDLVTSAR